MDGVEEGDRRTRVYPGDTRKLPTGWRARPREKNEVTMCPGGHGGRNRSWVAVICRDQHPKGCSRLRKQTHKTRKEVKRQLSGRWSLSLWSEIHFKMQCTAF